MENFEYTEQSAMSSMVSFLNKEKVQIPEGKPGDVYGMGKLNGEKFTDDPANMTVKMDLFE